MTQLVSVVIVGFNHEFCLSACLTSLLQQDHRAIEIIYVDNASADDSVALVAKFGGVEIIRNQENFGFAKGNNLGIERAQGRFVFILNPDTTLASDCITRLVAYMNEVQDVGISMPKLLHQDRPEVINSVGMTYNRHGRKFHIGDGEIDSGQYADPMEVLMVAGACMFCRKQMLDKIGGFDESYFAYGEDAELSLRTWWHGWRCVLVPNAVVYHLRNAAAKKSSAYYQKARYLVHRNQYWPLITYMPTSFLAHALPIKLMDEISIITKGFYRLFKKREMPVELRARFDSIRNLSSLVKKRQRMRLTRAIANQKLTELLG